MADPLYRQIADNLRRRIESGELPPGSQLPTELELREQYGNASRNTVRDAIRWLVARGLVISQPGRGTFVVETAAPFVVPLNPTEAGPGGDSSEAFAVVASQQGCDPTVSQPRVEVQNAADHVAEALGIKSGSPVVLRHQERFIDGEPSSMQTSFYPMDFVQRGAVDLLLAAAIPNGATKYVERKLGIRQAGYRDKLTVRVPRVGETTFFRLPDAANVLMVVVHSTAYDDRGKPMRYTVTVYPADRNHFVIEFGKVPAPARLVSGM